MTPHLFPLIGSTISYGASPFDFFSRTRKQHDSDIFTFVMLGMSVTVFLGQQGNDFVLNGKHADLNAEEVYGPLTVPIFGKGVVYDIPNEKFMQQKKLLKEGFGMRYLQGFVPLFVREVELYLRTNPAFVGKHGGIIDVSSVMSEIALYAAAGSLQGKEVRDMFDSEFAVLYRHLDDGFAPVNFMFPWLPIPVNRRRDKAQKAMAKLYLGIIQKRRQRLKEKASTIQSTTKETNSTTDRTSPPEDMLTALLTATYKDSTPIPDTEIANLMIALLMGGQHNTAATGGWIMLHLAHNPHLITELYAEQTSVLGPNPSQNPLTYDHLIKLTLHSNIIRETLRLHSPIHSIMRKAKRDLPIPNTSIIVPKGHILLASPSWLSRQESSFPNAETWDPHRWDTPSPTTTDTDGSANFATQSYLPFGAGRHRCPGETFAYAQLTAILATLVRYLEWEQVDPKAAVPETDWSSMFARPVHPARVRWRWREGVVLGENLEMGEQKVERCWPN